MVLIGCASCTLYMGMHESADLEFMRQFPIMLRLNTLLNLQPKLMRLAYDEHTPYEVLLKTFLKQLFAIAYCKTTCMPTFKGGTKDTRGTVKLINRK